LANPPESTSGLSGADDFSRAGNTGSDLEPGKTVKEYFAARIAPIMKDVGFRKYGRTWRLERPRMILVLNIQGSQWSSDFYVNLGVYLKDLGSVEYPSEAHCHLRSRMEEVVPPELRRIVVDTTELSGLVAGHKVTREELRRLEPFFRRQTTMLKEHALPRLLAMQEVVDVEHVATVLLPKYGLWKLPFQKEVRDLWKEASR
jgi:hypothetical protein